MQHTETLVIDLFAGPGGLGEGFASFKDENGNYPFKIGISVEKEASAHKTLTTRAFFRKIQHLPGGLDSYFKYLKKELTREELFSAFSEEAKHAQKETLTKPCALGDDNEHIHTEIKKLVSDHQGPTVLIGGPPCQAYSLAGRSRNAGITGYTPENDDRNFLYEEYLNVLSIAKPDVFVMENVRGILSAKVNGSTIFPKILEDLQNPGEVTGLTDVPGYKVYSLVVPSKDNSAPSYKKNSDFLIRSEQHGIPQARHRVILLGVRENIAQVPQILPKFEDTVSVMDAISDLPKLRSGFSKRADNRNDWERVISENAKTVKKLLSSKFDPSLVNGLDLQPFEGLSRKEVRREQSNTPKLPPALLKWITSNSPPLVINHETRGHMESDLLRYSYSAAYTQLNGGFSPKARDFPSKLAPTHQNWLSGSHADRFRTQAANRPSTTVTSHISKDGHYFIHYDPKQCRSLTIREAARLQTFPDNYFFEGNRTQQYVQVGNAVPPFLANQVAKVVFTLLRKAVTG